MKSQLALLLLLACSVYAIVIQPHPTRTVDVGVMKRSEGVPTVAPNHRYMKRDLEDTLSLYENWANDCTGNNGDNNAKVAVSDLNNLWQTVTNTVYCGNGKLKTVTKTVTAKATSTVTKGSGGSGGKNKPKKGCDDKCWSTYLWRKFDLIFSDIVIFITQQFIDLIDTYGYGITVAQGFTGIVMMLIGLYFLIFGFSSFRGTLGFVGFVFFGKFRKKLTW